MGRLTMRSWQRRITTIALVCASTIMASDSPPTTLPRGFLETLPLLIQLKEDEFEGILKYVEEKNSRKPHVDVNSNESTIKSSHGDSVNGNKGEQDEN